MGIAAGLLFVPNDASVVGLSIILCAVAAFCWIMYQPWTTEIAITNLRLIYKRGFFQRRTNDLQLRAIEEVQLRQNFWGRIFNYGNVEFHGTGVDDLRLPSEAVQEALGADHDAAQLPGKLSIPTSDSTVHIPS